MYKKFILPVLCAGLLFLCPALSSAQPASNHQNLKGTVIDKAVKTTLPGATVQVLTAETTPVMVKGTQTNAEGRFRLPAVPLGRYTVLVRYLGYKDAIVPNVLLTAGKETDVTIEMEEAILEGKEVVITAKTDKKQPLNDLSLISTRTFSVEETQRFAAAVNDPARMAASYAGVAMASDGNNHIVIRGNAPNGLLWRMEGVEIPNPNHFSNVGTAGGGISILSAQLLSNSDFSTGAFAAEYGNALSGVFDLKLRKGNSDKREYTLQAGVLGLDVATEGPMRAGSRTGSYLVNYRYSTLSLLGQLGVPLGDGKTDFQDISFNVWLPAGRIGSFTLFGFGGLSKQTIPGTADSLLWQTDLFKKFPNIFAANTGAAGLTHSKVWGSNTWLKTVVSASATANTYEQDEYLTPDYRLQRTFDNRFLQQKMTVSSVLSHKFNSRHFLKTGAYAHFIGFDFHQSAWDRTSEKTEEQVRAEGNTQVVHTFAQWQYRPSERWTMNAGLHNATLLLNHKTSLEPRVGIRFQPTIRQTFTLGYGLHTQMAPLATYFSKDAQGKDINANLGWSKAHHFVAGYDRSLTTHLHIKGEVYYQHLFDIPVERDARSSFSMLNFFDGIVYEKLDNSGLGKNYGAELTIEHFLHRGFYFLLSSAWYRSEYRGSDQIWRSSRFNGQTLNTLTAGKEWRWNRRGKDRAIGLNIKVTHMGGYRTTPIDDEASRAKGEAVYIKEQAFSQQLPYYFRADVGMRLRRNYTHTTTTLSLDLQNATNRKNVFDQFYDPVKRKTIYFYQAPLLPILAYKVEF
jgi:hypothetical protein